MAKKAYPSLQNASYTLGMPGVDEQGGLPGQVDIKVVAVVLLV